MSEAIESQDREQHIDGAAEAPLITIIIPTYGRQKMIGRAVASALAQTIRNVEVLVVDDGSPEQPVLVEDERLRLIRLPANKGVSNARNIAAQQARARYLAFLDDDDTLSPEMAEISLRALQQGHGLPEPVVALSGIQIVDETGRDIEVHLPPTLLRGKNYSLEDQPPGTSPFCKQTLVIERDVFLDLGGFDALMGSRVYSELFFRLNPACSILGIPVVTYYWTQHQAHRITRDPGQRQKGFYGLVNKHKKLFEAYPRRYSWYLRDHAYRSFLVRQYGHAAIACWRALLKDPRATLGWIIKGFPNETDPKNMP